MRWPRLSPPIIFRLAAIGLVVLILIAASLHLRHVPRDVGCPILGRQDRVTGWLPVSRAARRSA